MLSLFTPRVKQTRNYLAQRDAQLWAPLLSTSSNSKSSLAPTVKFDATNAATILPEQEIQVQNGDIEILSASLKQLVQGIQEKKWTSEGVTAAFIRAARRAHVLTNCLTEVLFESALARARELDAEFAKTGKLFGPLHGVPFSIKDHLLTKGARSTLGFTSWITERDIATESASIVQVYESLGAIPLCKTNVPQTMLSFETSNPLWGRTLNPHNLAHTCGGSSGGEAALLAVDGAAFGLGSDIGGSLRIPTGYCGVYSLKPTKGRFPVAGAAKFVEGQEGINTVFGPMGRSVEDIEYLTTLLVQTLHASPQEVADKGALTPREAQRKFNTEYLRAQPINVSEFAPLEVAKKRGHPLRIGYYSFDGYSKPSPAVLRSMDETVAALKAKYASTGLVELVEVDWRLLQAKRALGIFMAITSSDGFEQLLKPLKGDWMETALYLPVLTARMPRLLLNIVRYLVKYIIRDVHLAAVMQRAGRKSAGSFINAVADRNNFINDFEHTVWRGLDLDAIVCPLQPVPALPHGGAAKLSPIAISTILFNVMDNAVAMVPVSRVDASKGDSAIHPDRRIAKVSAEDRRKFDAWSNNEVYNKNSSFLISRTFYTEKKYDAEKMAGLPLSVQAVCRPNEEELSIGIAKLIDEALGPRGFAPGDFTRTH